MLTRRDPYVNMLRATMATFSAGLGGAKAASRCCRRFSALGLPDPFARRLVRNTQLILLEESNLAKVSDPAAGSGGIEALTQRLCEAARQLFQEIERAGGLFAALAQNLIQGKVATTRAAREANVARRKDVFTGASEFPDLAETNVAVPIPNPSSLRPWETGASSNRWRRYGLRALSDCAPIRQCKPGDATKGFPRISAPAEFTARSICQEFSDRAASGLARGFGDPRRLPRLYGLAQRSPPLFLRQVMPNRPRRGEGLQAANQATIWQDARVRTAYRSRR